MQPCLLQETFAHAQAVDQRHCGLIWLKALGAGTHKFKGEFGC